MPHAELVPKHNLRGVNHLSGFGVAELRIGGDKGAELAKEHQTLKHFLVLSDLFGGWIIHEQMLGFPGTQIAYAAAPFLGGLAELQPIQQSLE